jgi:hypothetical protein
LDSLLNSVARCWCSRDNARANLRPMLKYEAALMRRVVCLLSVAQPDLHALAGKWPDAALKRRLAVFAPDPPDSNAM